MQEANKQEDARTVALSLRENTALYLSIGFLILISIISIMLYVLSGFSERSVTKMREEIGQIDTRISDVSKDPSIIIAKIVQDNSIHSSIDLKNIVTYFRSAAIKANVVFNGFSITDDTITTTLTSAVGSSQHPDPISTIIKMMNDYAFSEWKNFKLGAIRQISGDNKKRTTTIELTVIPTSTK